MMILAITLTILATLIIIIRATKLAWATHQVVVSQVESTRDMAVKVTNQMAEEVIAARHARDHYRAALIEILRVTSEKDAAHQIANQFVNRQEP